VFIISAGIGEIKIHKSEPGKPHPPEFWAELAKEKIMQVADTAPQPIRDQAYAFQDQFGEIILNAIRCALKDHQAYVDLAKNQRG
jgi:hypothetical protein